MYISNNGLACDIDNKNSGVDGSTKRKEIKKKAQYQKEQLREERKKEIHFRQYTILHYLALIAVQFATTPNHTIAFCFT